MKIKYEGKIYDVDAFVVNGGDTIGSGCCEIIAEDEELKHIVNVKELVNEARRIIHLVVNTMVKDEEHDDHPKVTKQVLFEWGGLLEETFNKIEHWKDE